MTHAFKFGPWTISRVRSQGRQTGWGASCNEHTDDDFPHRRCKVNRPYSGMTDHQLVLGLKRWLIAGLLISNTDPAAKSKHMALDIRAMGMEPVRPGDDPDEDIKGLFPELFADLAVI